MLQRTHEKVPFPFAVFFPLVVLCLVFLSGCKSNPNVDLCLFLTKENGKVLPFDQWEIFCTNMRTGDTKNIAIEDGDKMYMMNSADYERVRKWYKSGCADE